jgi:hypothetical protein
MEHRAALFASLPPRLGKRKFQPEKRRRSSNLSLPDVMRPSKAIKHDEPSALIGAALQRGCCDAKCMTEFDLKEWTAAIRNAHVGRNEQEVLEFVSTSLRGFACTGPDNGIIFRYAIKGKRVCKPAWCSFYHISDWKYR